MSSGGGHAGVEGLSGRSSRKWEEYVVESSRTPNHLVTALGSAHHQYFHVGTHEGSMSGPRVLFLEFDDLPESPPFDRVENIILHVFAGVGDAAIAVAEHERAVEVHVFHQAQGLGVVLFGFSAESDHDVGAECDSLNTGPEFANQIQELGPIVASFHRREHPIRSGLNGKMNVRHHTGQFCHGVDESIREVDGVGARETNAGQTLDAGHGVQQVRELHVFVAIGVDGLPKQRYLAVASRGETTGLAKDFARRYPALTSPCERNDTERAEFVTSSLNRDLPAHTIVLRVAIESFVHFVPVQMHVDRRLARPGSIYELRDAAVGVWSGHQRDVGRAARNLFSQVFGHAPGDSDDQAWVLFAMLQELAGSTVDSILRLLTDGAGVDQNDIRLLRISDPAVPATTELAQDQRGVGLIHLTAEGLHVHRGDARIWVRFPGGSGPRRRPGRSAQLNELRHRPRMVTYPVSGGKMGQTGGLRKLRILTREAALLTLRKVRKIPRSRRYRPVWRLMRRTCLTVLALSLVNCTEPPRPEKATNLDQIQPSEDQKAKGALGPLLKGPVATVAGAKITGEAFRSIYDLKVKKYEDRGREIPPSADRRYRKSITERLIYHEVLKQETEKQGVTHDEAALAERIDQQKRGIRDWDKHLERRGETESSLKEMYISELRERAILEKQGKLTVSAEDVEAEYEKIKGNYKSDKPRVRASHVLIPVGPPTHSRPKPGEKKAEPDPEQEKKWEAEARAKADEVYKLTGADGADFAALAREHSTGPSATKGGDLGIFTADRMVEEFSRVAFKLKAGQISKPVKTKFGYHIIQAKGRWGPGELPREALADQITDRLSQRKLHQGRRELKQSLLESYDVKDHMKETLGPEPERRRPPRATPPKVSGAKAPPKTAAIGDTKARVAEPEPSK